MLTGNALLLDPGWSTVEGDLYDISRRVQEYDSEARLVREDQSGALGLGRLIRSEMHPEPVVVFVVHCLDYRTGQRLYGEPDPRVLTHQRIADGHRIKSTSKWIRTRRDAMRAERQAESAARGEWSRDKASEYVWRHNRDNGRRLSMQVSKEIH